MRVVTLAGGLLTNVECLDLLRERAGTSARAAAYPQPHDPFPTELQCYDALAASPAGAQARERVQAFIDAVDAVELTRAEVVQLINLKPRERVVVHAIVESCAKRLSDDEVDDLLHLCEEYL